MREERFIFLMIPSKGNTVTSLVSYGTPAKAMMIGDALARRILAGRLRAPREAFRALAECPPDSIELVVINEHTKEREQSRIMRANPIAMELLRNTI